MPFRNEPPHLPARNPTGVYEREFELPEAWAGRRVVLHVGAAESVVIVELNRARVGVGQAAQVGHAGPLRVIKGGEATALCLRQPDVGPAEIAHVQFVEHDIGEGRQLRFGDCIPAFGCQRRTRARSALATFSTASLALLAVPCRLM